MNKLTAIASIGTLALLGACASNTTPPPATTPDGLELVSSDKHSAVYIKPEADLQIYKKFGIVPCKVAFRKNWQRDYNSAHRDASQQVKQRDIDRIKTDLGAECTTFFTNALSNEPAYDVVEEWQTRGRVAGIPQYCEPRRHQPRPQQSEHEPLLLGLCGLDDALPRAD